MGAFAASIAATNYRPAAPAIEDAGVRAGEIIAYRAWQLFDDGLLHGMYITDYIWRPKAVEHAPQLDRTWGRGLHAFKTLAEARKQYDCFSTTTACGVVFGEVALWGDVIEHEHGYRAEYATIRNILIVHDSLFRWPTHWLKKFVSWSKISKLRKRYNCAGALQ